MPQLAAQSSLVPSLVFGKHQTVKQSTCEALGSRQTPGTPRSLLEPANSAESRQASLQRYLSKQRLQKQLARDRLFKKRLQAGYDDIFKELYLRSVRAKAVADDFGHILFPFVPQLQAELAQLELDFDIHNKVETYRESYSVSDKKLVDWRSSRNNTHAKTSRCATPRTCEAGNQVQPESAPQSNRQSKQRQPGDDASEGSVRLVSEQSDGADRRTDSKRELALCPPDDAMPVGVHSLKKAVAKNMQIAEHMRNQIAAFIMTESFDKLQKSKEKVELTKLPLASNQEVFVFSVTTGLEEEKQETGTKADKFKRLLLNQGHDQNQVKTRRFEIHGQTPLPLLGKLESRVFFAPPQYKIREALAASMSAVIKNPKDRYKYEICKVILDDNDMSDRSMATLLRALKTRDELKSFVSKKNVIGDEAARHLSQMLCDQVAASPLSGDRNLLLAALNELVLVSNKHSPSALHHLLQQLPQGRSLQRLTLSDTIKTELHAAQLLEFLRVARLSHLDISWSKLTAVQVAELFGILSQQRSLAVLNLSFIEMSKEEVLAPEFSGLVDLLKESQMLTHLDLSGVSLPDAMMQQLFEAIAASRSLQVVHLSGNVISEEAAVVMQAKLEPLFAGMESEAVQSPAANQSECLPPDDPASAEHRHAQPVARLVAQPSFRRHQSSA